MSANPPPQLAPEWLLKSMTIRMLVVAILGIVARLTHRSFNDSEVAAWVDFGGSVMTIIGIIGAWIGRVRAQRSAVAAVQHAALTGEVVKP